MTTLTLDAPRTMGVSQEAFAAIAELCLRAKREQSASYFRLIEEMLPTDTTDMDVINIIALCRWNDEAVFSDFAYGQIYQRAKWLAKDEWPGNG